MTKLDDQNAYVLIKNATKLQITWL